uniref:Uncharacterized protein n=1 Tax=Peronospora matthiolae TaxID=2874970 RepID=A0AAV1U3X5_9STRA
MGNSLSMCGLGTSNSDYDVQRHHECKDFARPVDRSVLRERKHSLSTATDSSVASILSNSEQLIPDAFMPMDIQVLSQRRQRQHHRHDNDSTGSRSSYSLNYSSSSKASSRVSNLSSRGVGLVHVVRNKTAAEESIPSSVSNKYTVGIKTASSSFGYSDDEGDPAAVSSRRGDRPSGRSFE